MQSEIVRICHEQGHFANKKTAELINRQFYIPKVEEKIQLCIKNCVRCILMARKQGKQDGFLNPIPKGDVPLETFHVDHLGHLAETKKKYKNLYCVVDAFSKFVWLYPTKTVSAVEVIQKLEQQKAIFGNPNSIISDRGAAFTSEEFQKYCAKEGIQHVCTTTGMPTGNGQIERINSIIIPALAKMSINKPEEWYKYTDVLQRFLNNSFQRSIGMTPFEVLFGTKMRSPEDAKLLEILQEEYVKNYSEKRDKMRENAKCEILKIQEENLKNYNKKRKRALQFKVGDLVAIKRTQFFGGSKLKSKFLGPYTVTKINGHDRYDVKKIGNQEGPNKTATGAEFMKPFYSHEDTDDNEEDEIEVKNVWDGDFEGVSGTNTSAGGPSGSA